MVGTMPYSLEKGPYLSVMEDHVNQSAANLRSMLTNLREGRSIADLGGFNSNTIGPDATNAPNSEGGGPFSLQHLIDHTNQDWFGWRRNPLAKATGNASKWHAQPAWDPAANPTTGFWQDWYGDAEGVLRKTLIRGFEVALGLAPDEEIAKGQRGGQRWQVEAYWRCPLPWFEGWVTWRKHGDGPRQGQVTIIVSTPGHGTPLKNTPVRTDGKAGYVLNPSGTPGPRGMNVISQTYHQPWPKQTTEASGLGEWTFPTQALGYVSKGEIVTVAPAEAEGGLLDPPRVWAANPGRRVRPPMSPSAQP